MNWPVLYINAATNEPLRVITSAEWCGSLAARYELSHVTPGSHFFVDSAECVYELVGKGFLSPGFQIIEPVVVERPDVLALVRQRAAAWLGSAPENVAAIVDDILKSAGRKQD